MLQLPAKRRDNLLPIHILNSFILFLRGKRLKYIEKFKSKYISKLRKATETTGFAIGLNSVGNYAISNKNRQIFDGI